MTIKLLKGDCLERLRELPDECIDLVLADPPYGETIALWDTLIPFDALWPALYRVCKPKAVIVMTAMQPFSSRLILSNERDYRYSWYWHKRGVTGFANAKRQPLRNIEEVCIFYQQLGVYNPQGIVKLQGAQRHRANGDIRRMAFNGNIKAGKGANYVQEATNYPTQLLSIGRDEEKVHPTQKPVALMSYLVRTYSNVGDTVLDFCMGSGTTGVAAVALSRDFIGIEKNEEYYGIAKTRIARSRSPFDSDGSGANEHRGKSERARPQRQTRRG